VVPVSVFVFRRGLIAAKVARHWKAPAAEGAWAAAEVAGRHLSSLASSRLASAPICWSRLFSLLIWRPVAGGASQLETGGLSVGLQGALRTRQVSRWRRATWRPLCGQRMAKKGREWGLFLWASWRGRNHYRARADKKRPAERRPCVCTPECFDTLRSAQSL